MIFSRFAELQVRVNPLVMISRNRFNNCLAFSTIKNKAEQYLCAAVAYRTLADIKSDKFFYSKPPSKKIRYSQVNNQKIKTIHYEPFSLREKVIHNLNMLKLDSEKNREEIRNIFEIEHGLIIRQQSQNTTRFILGGIDKRQNEQTQLHFAFNPTLLFEEIADIIDKYNREKLRNIYTGKFGIGKSSVWLLIANLTRFAFLFRKEGSQGKEELEKLLKKNYSVLKKIISLSDQESQQISEKKTEFLETVKEKFYSIPFIFFYTLPEKFPKQTMGNCMNFKKADFLAYFTEEQLKRLGIRQVPIGIDLKQIYKINQQNTQIFLPELLQKCNQNGIKFFCMIDQINLLFKKIRIKKRMQSTLSQQQIEKMRDQDEEYRAILRSLKLYSAILNTIHGAYADCNMILTASANVQWGGIGQQQGDNRPSQYAQDFFSKQVSINKYYLKYSKQSHTELWQKQMDIAFIFQVQKNMYSKFSKLNALSLNKLPQNYLQRTKQILQQLRYRFHNEMAGNQPQEQKWSQKTRHLFIRQSLMGVANNALQQLLKLIFDEISKPEKEKETNSKKLQKVLLSKLISLKNSVKSTIEKIYFAYILHQKQKGNTQSYVYLKQLFYLQLYNKVDQMAQDPSNQHQVIIENHLLQDILNKSFLSKQEKYQYLSNLIDKDYQQLITFRGQTALKNNCSLQELKKKLQVLTRQIYFPVFVSQLISESPKIRAEITQLIVKYILCTANAQVVRVGDTREEFNIINQKPHVFTSILGPNAKFVMERNGLKRALQKQLTILAKDANTQQIISKVNEKIEDQSDKKSADPITEQQIDFLNFCQKNNHKEFSQQVVRQWKKSKNVQFYTLESQWGGFLELLSQKQTKIPDLTLGLKPQNKNNTNSSPNNPYFDLFLIKKIEETNKMKEFKFIFIDVTIGQTKSKYQEKIRGIVDFKDLFILNEKQFFEKIQMQFWNLCPQNMAGKYRKEWEDMFVKEQKKRDKLNGVPSEPIKYRVVAFQDLKLETKDQQILKKYKSLSNLVNQSS